MALTIHEVSADPFQTLSVSLCGNGHDDDTPAGKVRRVYTIDLTDPSLGELVEEVQEYAQKLVDDILAVDGEVVDDVFI